MVWRQGLNSWVIGQVVQTTRRRLGTSGIGISERGLPTRYCRSDAPHWSGAGGGVGFGGGAGGGTCSTTVGGGGGGAGGSVAHAARTAKPPSISARIEGRLRPFF